MRFKLSISLFLLCQLGFANATSDLKAPEILDKTVHGIQSANAQLNQELQAEISALLEDDLSARAKIDFQNVSNQDLKIVTEITARHNQRLKEIISTYGWPGIRLVGLKGATDMWLLVQHQDYDLPFQKQCLVLLKEAVEKQDAQYREYAYLLDRVRKNENLPQVYGTQWEFKEGKWRIYSVENPENLNQRRFEAGHIPIEEYIEVLKTTYHIKDTDISLSN